jgi:hypothetical protein
LEADGLLVPREELLSRLWPDIVVSEDNLKVQISALRKALGADRDFIRTEFGRGYRFTGVLCTNTVTDACQRPTRPKQRYGGTLFPQNCRRSPGIVSVRADLSAGAGQTRDRDAERLQHEKRIERQHKDRAGDRCAMRQRLD